MRFSLDWLRQHVEIDLDPEQLGRRLTAVGLAVEGIESVDGDTALEVEITGNRPDCMNHRGLAREIAALTGRPLRPLDTSVTESSNTTAEITSVEIEDAELCSRYTARVLLGVRIGPSPVWLQDRLRAIGILPKSNVVDAANFVLWDLGHPLHTFDLNRLDGKRIIVRRARAGEKLVTVADEQEHALDESMLVIADASRPVAVAGVMGGLESGISAATRDVLVESAWFDPVSVRRTARALGMRTDASHRFERGADPEMTLPSADLLCRLILETAGGECRAGAVDAVARRHPRRGCVLRRERLGALLGAPVPDDKVGAILRSLEITVEETDEGWKATFPSHRSDLLAEEDLIEEVARSVGYDAFPSTLPDTSLPPERRPRDETDIPLRRSLAAAGYCEVIGYAMVSEEEDALFAPTDADPALKITNPLSERWEVMRRSIFPGLMRVAGHNLRHGQRDFSLFEIGTIFHRARPGERTRAGSSSRPEEASLPREERVVGLVGCGRAPAGWNLPRREIDLYDATGAVAAIARSFRAPAPEIVPGAGTFLHPHQAFSARIDGEEIAFGGTLHPDVVGRLELARGCVVAQVSLTALERLAGYPPAFEPIARFPSISRDVSAIVPEQRPYAEVAAVVSRALGDAPARFVLTDRYTGRPLADGQVSLTFNICIEPRERTWTLEEIDALMGRVMRALTEDLGAEIRQ